MSHGDRVRRHSEVSTVLAMYSDQQLGTVLENAQVRGVGIGGSSVLFEVAGVPVFAKRVSLTDLEMRADNVMSTANLFGLPPFFQYGIALHGSAGFGAWRELAAHQMTTSWVLAGESPAFPLLYHWRVLPGAAPSLDEHADIDASVRYWAGSAEVRHRLDALAQATSSIVLFQELIPHTLDDWLADQLTAGPDAATAACAMVESCILTDMPFMADQGLLHLDGHFANVLTDGHRLYLADFGLATSSEFDLSPEETQFQRRNRSHDLAYALMRLVNWIVTHVCDTDGSSDTDLARRDEYIRACAAGAEPAGIPPTLAMMLCRYAPVAALMNDFYWNFFGTDRATLYPQERIDIALERCLSIAGDPAAQARNLGEAQTGRSS